MTSFLTSGVPTLADTPNPARCSLRRRSLAVFAGMALTLVMLLPAAAQAAEEETHLFDATLSLTGGCTTSSLDPVPDPGCPGGEHPPLGPFAIPVGVATDPYGNIYVDSYVRETNGEEAHIDVFDPAGQYLTEVVVPGAQAIAVDSTGHLYASTSVIGGPEGSEKLVRLDPTVYKPQAGEIEYGAVPVVIPVTGGLGPFPQGLAVDPTNQHLYLGLENHVNEYGSAAEGNPLITEEIGKGTIARSRWIAIDAASKRLYVSDFVSENSVVRVFDLDDPSKLLMTIDGSGTPEKRFLSLNGATSIAPDEANGHVFVFDPSARKVYEFDESGGYVSTIRHGFESQGGASTYLDNGEESPNRGYLFVPSGESVPGHSFAFEPKPEPHPPVVESTSFTGVTEDEAILGARINTQGTETHYAFEYISQQAFEEGGFVGAIVAGEGDLGASSEGVAVSAVASGLSPGIAYRFRVVAESECELEDCADVGERVFVTFSEVSQPGACENEAVLIGTSAPLPDCRAYELVTPSNTNGRSPRAVAGGQAGSWFGSPTASPQGGSVGFLILGGVIPGFEGAGAFNGDGYVSSRTSSGWDTASNGPNGAQAVVPNSGSVSPDQHHMLWSTGGFGGSLSIEGKPTNYLRYPDGSFHLVGQGSLGTAPQAEPIYVAEDAGHIVFEGGIQLEPSAPPEGTEALYDRTPDEVTHVVSLLPGDLTPAAKEDATYEGASADGSAVAFKLGVTATSPLYLRLDNAQTLIAAPPGAAFAGLSAAGRYLFYLAGGDLHRFDSQSEDAIQITESGDATPVNVSFEGAGAYFVSPSLLGDGPNPNGAEPVNGAQNLYHWDGSSVGFVATVTERDVKGENSSFGFFGGLGLWLEGVRDGEAAIDPSRATPDGSALIFESRANITGYDAGGKAEIYRYDSGEGTLTCLSCDPTLATPGSDASLISPATEGVPLNKFSLVPNLSPDGKRAFFQSSERLVLADNDATQDVYEWEAEGKGSCAVPGGCLFLISSGQSARPNYLWGVSESGDDVFFSTSDLLLPVEDQDESPSIYDARVGGGFPLPPAPPGECLGEACQTGSAAPEDSALGSSVLEGTGNVVPRRRTRCPKGRHRVRRGGKTRCLPARKQNQKRKRGVAKRRARR